MPMSHCEPKVRIRRVTLAVILISLFSMSAQAQNRMPPIPDDEMTEAQKEAVEEFRSARGEPGGPWAVILRSPELLNRCVVGGPVVFRELGRPFRRPARS